MNMSLDTFLTVLLLGMLTLTNVAFLNLAFTQRHGVRGQAQLLLHQQPLSGTHRSEPGHSHGLQEEGLLSTLGNMNVHISALSDSLLLLTGSATAIKDERRRREREAATERAETQHAARKQSNSGSKAVRKARKAMTDAIQEVKLVRSNVKSKLSKEIEDLLPPASGTAGALHSGQLPVGVQGFQNPQQKIAAQFDNEYPSEPVSDRPGPAYTPQADDWADDGLTPEQENDKRKETVMDAFKHSWDGYVEFAWGKDELQPRSKTAKNWNEGSPKGMGLTILDALTTMHLMGHMEEDKEKALEWVRNDLNFNIEVEASAFESTIRCLGSLLSTYELTGEKDAALLEKAVDLADRLLYVFNTSHGLPHSTVHLKSRHHFNQQWAGGGSILSEFGTMQLEFRTLSYHTKNPIYDMKATHAMAIILSKAPRDMLCPTYMSTMHLRWMTDHISIGALGDSFYEYLLKQYLLTGKTEDRYKDAYLRAAHAIMDKLVFYSRPSNWAYIAEYRRKDFYHKMDHLACFAAGMLAFGARNADPEHQEKTMKIAKELTKTCTLMYTRQKSGVSPEYVEFPGGTDFINGPGYYILRPEAMEAVFYMWRLTKDQHWRDVGWKMFAAINRWCRVAHGFAGIKEVNVKKPINDNLQQSFWFAETLKYSFLLFAPDDTLNLDEWVLNTEGHPLKVRNRDPLDLWRDYEEEHGHPAWYPPPSPGVDFIETEMMAKDRANGKVKVPARDAKGEEFEDGAADDEGLPFDNVNGMMGIKRKGIPAYGNYGDRLHTPAPPPATTRPHSARETEKPVSPFLKGHHPTPAPPKEVKKWRHADDEDEDKEADEAPPVHKSHGDATDDERKSALKKEIERRRKERAAAKKTDDDDD